VILCSWEVRQVWFIQLVDKRVDARKNRVIPR